MSKFEEETEMEFIEPIYNVEPIIKPLIIKIKYHDSDMEKINILPNGDWVDLRSADDVELNVGDYKMISLGVSMKLPDDYEAEVKPRSSTFKNWGILQTNSVACIDNSYSGNNDIWRMPVYATKNTIISKGDRICQFRIVKKQPKLEFIEVDNMEDGDRGGFGSSGIK